MAFVSTESVNILGVASAVPKQKRINTNPKFIVTTGIQEKRIANFDTCTSDLCHTAAERLLVDLKVNRDEIDILIFVSQTPDYILPVTSTILQHKLGLPQSCICFDIPLGCSGYVYGLSVISSMISTGKLRKGLLLVGETTSKIVEPGDESVEPLFGDAGTATLLEYDQSANKLLFDLGSDGSGYQTIIIPGGSSRSKTDRCYVDLNGVDVFNFGVSKIPKVVNEFLIHYQIDRTQVDYYIFHQANKFMNDKIYKKLALPDNSVLTSLESFGNTSSATIPLTLTTNKTVVEKNKKLIMCGFGVGLSWGTVYIHLSKDLHCSNLVEI